MKSDEKKCPRCAEVIKKEAIVCKHCRHELPAVASSTTAVNQSQNSALGGGCIVVVVLLLAVGMCSRGNENKNESSAVAIPTLTFSQAKELEDKNWNQIKVKLAEARALPESNITGNLRAYEELVKLAPANSSYVEKREQYKSRQAMADRYSEDPKTALEISNFNWTKGGFGSVQLVRLTVKNLAPFAIKDFELTCVHQGPSGTDMDRNVRTVYELVPANGSRRIKEVNMGLIAGQAASSSCEITSAVKA